MTSGVVSPPLLADDRSLLEKLVAPLADLPPDERAAAYDDLIAGMDADEAAFLMSWEGQRRPSQVIDPVADAFLVCLLGGKGAGKTRGGTEAICDRIEADELRHGAFVSRTPGDVRRVMIEGEESGFMVCAERRGIRANYQPSLAQIDIVDGGTITLYSAEVPDSLRGPQHDTLWADEFAAWSQKVDAMGNTTFTNAIAGLRLGDHPLGIFTTTPKALPAIRDILTDETGLWRVARMTTWGNAANLAPTYLAALRKMFGGSRLEAQEFLGEYVEDTEGALWTTLGLEATRIRLEPGQTWRDVIPELIWAYVAVDPSVAADGGGDECGIVGGGVGVDRRFYVTHDWSDHLSPHAWAERAIRLYHELGAIAIVPETNNGGALVEEMIHSIDPRVVVDPVRAANGKRARAEPTSRLWQAAEGDRPLASIVGSMPALEGELTGWDAERSRVSPNRLDGLAWLGHKCLDHLWEQQATWSASAGNLRLPV